MAVQPHHVAARYTVKNGFLEGDAEEVTAVMEMLQTTLAVMRALRWYYQTCHWVAKGDPYYGDHLLFERLYDQLGENIDKLAEKMVAYFGPDSVFPTDAMELSYDHLAEWIEREPECMYRRGLLAEEDFQDLLETVYEEIDDKGLMTLGLDDFIMALANDHEGHVYLLQQRTQNHKKAAVRKALTNMERTWGGYSSFDPRRHAEQDEEEE